MEVRTLKCDIASCKTPIEKGSIYIRVKFDGLVEPRDYHPICLPPTQELFKISCRVTLSEMKNGLVQEKKEGKDG